MEYSVGSVRARGVFVFICMAVLFLFWLFPIAALASLLSYSEIKKVMPWLGALIDRNEKIRAIVQNSLPSVAMISLNACLPFILEGTCAWFPPRLSGVDLLDRAYLLPRISGAELDRVLFDEKVSPYQSGIVPAANMLQDTSSSSSSTSSLFSSWPVLIGS